MIIVTLAVSVWACDNDAGNVNPRINDLTKGEWIMRRIDVKSTPGGWNNIFPTLQICATDNILIFREDKTFELNEGAAKCNGTDPQIIANGNWLFKESETKINYNGSDWAIEKLDGISMVLSAVGPSLSVDSTRIWYAAK